MAFVKTWDETVPADTESVGAGAGRIRDEKEAVRERLAIDHNFKATEGADANIGKHKQVELIEKADDPSNPTAGIVIYDKSGKLYLRKKTGAAVEMIDETAQTINGVKTFASTPIIPAAAPTKDADVANKKYVDDSIAGAVLSPQVHQVTGTSNISTASASYVDMADMVYTDNFAEGKIFVMFVGFILNKTSEGAANPGIRILIDDVQKAEIITTAYGNGCGNNNVLVYSGSVTAGSHTIKVQWKKAGGHTLYHDGSTKGARVLTVMRGFI